MSHHLFSVQLIPEKEGYDIGMGAVRSTFAILVGFFLFRQYAHIISLLKFDFHKNRILMQCVHCNQGYLIYFET